MSVALAAMTSLTLVAFVVVILRVRREHNETSALSNTTATAVWCLYFALAGATALSALFATWSLGLPRPLEVAIGGSSTALGFTLALSALISSASLRRRSATRSNRLIQRGAFRLSRNPQDVGIALMLIGTSFLLDSGLALLATFGFWAAVYICTGYEESRLAMSFGSEYRRYRKRTPRFLGLPK
jgi:protein-S-isoprenylcysteine O-methyltransferase Ste14